jgi:peptide/nickel transport system ATP-binding protein
MLQRVLIGLAVLPRPALLVADEPTSALDVTIQKRILDLLSRLQQDLGISLLLITHDLAIAAERADQLVVLRGGVLQEAGPTEAVFSRPRSDYARKLHADVPALNPDRYAALRDPGFARARSRSETAGRHTDAESIAGTGIALRHVSKSFVVEGRRVQAVEDVSFQVAPGTTHALVGESGSGKTTTIRLLLGLEQPDRGEIRVAGAQVNGRDPGDLRTVWRQLQFVYQNPYTSLDPTWKVGHLVAEPLERYRIASRSERFSTSRPQRWMSVSRPASSRCCYRCRRSWA